MPKNILSRFNAFVISVSVAVLFADESHARSERHCYYSKAGLTLEIPVENEASCQDLKTYLDGLSSFGEDILGVGGDRRIDPREQRLRDNAAALREREQAMNERSHSSVRARTHRTRTLNAKRAVRLSSMGLRSPTIILAVSPEYRQMEKEAIDSMLDILFPGLFQ